jgi:hypothetical protein
MKKIIISAIICSFLAISSLVYARAYNTESITVSSVAIGFTSATISPERRTKPIKAVFIVETAQIRFTVDGSTPTTTVGFLAEIGDIVTINGEGDIKNFKAIRTGASDATIQPIYFTDRD